MLNFIVLGQIPGTTFQITFKWLFGATLLLFLIVELVRMLRPQGTKIQKQPLEAPGALVVPPSSL